MKKEALKSPRLPAAGDFSSVELLESEFAPDTMYESLFLSGGDFSDQSADHLIFSICHFQGVYFGRAEWPAVDMSDTRLAECDLANASWHKGILDRVEIIGCRLLGLKANEARLWNVVFRECNGSLAQFRFSAFKAVRFESCNLNGADFQDADLRGVVFRDCDLREARMSGAKLEDADLRGSNLEGIRMGIESLNGAIVEPAQAAYLAGLMGLQVRTLEERT
jgi:uncharacterized protein YjbI with pentapeptide repeats